MVSILLPLNDGKHILVSPQAIEKIRLEDILIVIGSDEEIHKFEKKDCIDE